MGDSIFPPTHWSAVIKAAIAEPDQARRAFEQLCGEYRDAIAHWMRLQGLAPEDAEDAAHDFLVQWLRRENPLRNFSRGERRFREFLRVCLRRFLSDWRHRQSAARRGGSVEHVPWEHDDLIEDGSDSLPHLDYALAVQIHQEVLARMKSAWEPKISLGKFEQLRAVALGETANPGYEALAHDMATTVGTLKSSVFRFRREYHAGFRDAVGRQVEPSLIDSEVLYLHDRLLHPPSAVPKLNQYSPQPPRPDSR